MRVLAAAVLSAMKNSISFRLCATRSSINTSTVSRRGRVGRGTIAALCALIVMAAVAAPASSSEKSAAVLSSLPADAQGPISTALGKDDSGYWTHRGAEGFRLENPQQGLAAEFSRQGAELRTHNLRWVIKTRGYGYGDALQRVKAVAPQGNANRVEYQRDVMTEWYENGPLGLEQGFTLTHRPDNANGQALTLELSFRGDLVATLESGASALQMRSKDGKAVLRYTGLKALDANGRELPSWLEVRGERLLVRVNDKEARYPVVVDPWLQVAEVTASDGNGGDQFGYSVAINGSTMVVGAPYHTVGSNAQQGAAYVFVESGGTWSEQAELTEPSGSTEDNFGFAVAFNGSTILVGAPGANGGAGELYFFNQNGGEYLGLAAPQGALHFGYSLAVLNSNVILIGAPGNNLVAAYSGTGQLLATLNGPDSELAMFGASVAADSTTGTVWVGAPGANSSQGSLYLFNANSWIQEGVFVSSDGVAGDKFGYSVAAGNGTVVVGAPGHTVGSNSQQGAAYVFGQNPSGGWAQQQELSEPSGAAADNFGFSVAINSSTILVGAPHYNQSLGAAYLFPVGGTGVPEAALLATDGAAGDQFGASVALSGSTVVAGATAHLYSNAAPGPGAAYTFVPGQTCTVTATTDTGATGDILYCVNQANAASANTAFMINFAPSLNGKTITLSSLLVLNNPNSGVITYIQGPGAGQLTISGGNATTVFLIYSGTVNISGLTIANGAADDGGGILNESTLTVSNSAFTGNLADVGGAILNAGTLTVSGSTFSGNTATIGGAITVGGGSATITNSTFSGNAANVQGGALVVENSSTATVSNSTISGNTATVYGGGIFNGGTLTLADSIIAGNSTGLNPGDDCDNCGSQSAPNVVGTPYNQINPQLASLGNYGGPTQTMLPLPGSPAFCVGTTTLPSPLTLPSTDQRGFPRTNTTYSGFNSSTPCVDVGAVQTNYQSIQFANSGGIYTVQTGDSFGQFGVSPPSTPAPIVSITENGQNIGGVPVTLTYSSPTAPSGSLAGLGPVTTVASTGANFSSLIAYYPAAYTLSASQTLFTPSGGQPVSLATNASLTVFGLPTIITLNSVSYIVGTPLNFTGTIAPGIPNSSGPSLFGTVTIYQATIPIATAAVRGFPSGAENFAFGTSNYLPPGTYPITAVFNQNGEVYASSVATGTLTITQANVNITASSNANPSTYSQPLTLTAAVTPGVSTSLQPTGGVTFTDTTTSASLGTSTLNNGQASITLPNGLSVGTHTIQASYSGDVNFAGPREASFNQTVNQATNTVTFTTPPPPSAVYGSSFTVAASGLGTGAITYTSDGVVCTNAGATYSMIAGSGTCTVTATQATDTDYQSASTSSPVTATLAQSTLGVALTNGTNPSSFGQSLTFTATLTSNTGMVTRRDQTRRQVRVSPEVGGSVTWSTNTGCGTTAVTGGYPGTATCTTSVLRVGNETVTADYPGDANHSAVSNSVKQQVEPSTSVEISTASINFGNVALNAKSAAQAVTVTNTGSTEQNISVAISGEFEVSSSTCAILPSTKSCKIEVYFLPTQPGAQTGTLTITDNAPNSPQTVSLSGTGIAVATLTPDTATYSPLPVGTVSAPKTFWLTNTSNTTMSINAPVISGDFEVIATDCGAILTPKGKCWISVSFAPTQTGTRTGQLSVSDHASNSPQTSNLTGTGK
jgi:trimeric autotransporter adhesin